MSKYIISFLAYSMFFLMLYGMVKMDNNIVTISFVVGYISASIGREQKDKKNEPNVKESE